MTYEEAQAYIGSLAPRGWRMGLDRMQAFVERAGFSDALGGDAGPQFLHVAGTNGKGSVTAYLQSLLVEGGVRTGAFFSPFVFDPRERVQLGRDYISKADLALLTEQLIPVAESFTDTPFGGITEFEFKAALGFLYWKVKGCQWVGLEVGLGGRLDATNVVTPRAGVIVSIGLDHTSVLGHTVEEIAYEKAGIIKPGVPVVVGYVSEPVFKVIDKVAREASAPVWRYGRDVCWSEGGEVKTPKGIYNRLRPGIPGALQGHNLALAIGALDAAGISFAEEQVRRGAEKASAPGRFQRVQYRGKTLLLDGAHNPAAARVLVEGLKPHLAGSKAILVTNMVAGHDPADFYREIAPLVSAAHVVPIQFHRALQVEETARALREWVPEVKTYGDVAVGVEAAVERASEDEVVLVTGSFYLVGEVGAALGLYR